MPRSTSKPVNRAHKDTMQKRKRKIKDEIRENVPNQNIVASRVEAASSNEGIVVSYNDVDKGIRDEGTVGIAGKTDASGEDCQRIN
ncbi:hypothetical protein RJT34_12228 [Clitoria ternatea]|uniref:Uncharacterized protein n=1 Tax=Clitoria ternatea TaxID=43366 RepID=A0AAN9JLD0_CLITE